MSAPIHDHHAGRSRAAASAELATAARAISASERDPRVRNPDSMARQFLGASWRLYSAPLVRSVVKLAYARAAPGMYWWVTARTKFFDEHFGRELGDGARQVVSVGAGFDSRAWRFAGALGAAPVFEIDLPRVLAVKRARLARAGHSVPPGVRFVDTDLHDAAPAPLLAAAGFDPSLRTIFVFEGVTMYFSPDVVRRWFRFIAAAAARSAVIFDSFSRGAIAGNPASGEGGDAAIRYARRVLGTRLGFGLDPADTEPFCQECGLDLVDVMDAPALRARYLVGTDGRPRGPVAAYLHCAVARTP